MRYLHLIYYQNLIIMLGFDFIEMCKIHNITITLEKTKKGQIFRTSVFIDIEDNNYDNGKKSNILELCVIGICAYNNQNIMYAGSRDFFRNLLDNLELYLNNESINERIDDDIKEYYRTTLNNFVNGKELDGMNSYLVNKNAAGKGNSNVRVYTKSTPIGRALADKEAAFANVLIIPSILVLIYLVLVIGYFLLK